VEGEDPSMHAGTCSPSVYCDEDYFWYSILRSQRCDLRVPEIFCELRY